MGVCYKNKYKRASINRSSFYKQNNAIPGVIFLNVKLKRNRHWKMTPAVNKNKNWLPSIPTRYLTLKLLEFSLCSVDFEVINTELVKKSLYIVFHIRSKHTQTHLHCHKLIVNSYVSSLVDIWREITLHLCRNLLNYTWFFTLNYII